MFTHHCAITTLTAITTLFSSIVSPSRPDHPLPSPRHSSQSSPHHATIRLPFISPFPSFHYRCHHSSHISLPAVKQTRNRDQLWLGAVGWISIHVASRGVHGNAPRSKANSLKNLHAILSYLMQKVSLALLVTNVIMSYNVILIQSREANCINIGTSSTTSSSIMSVHISFVRDCWKCSVLVVHAFSHFRKKGSVCPSVRMSFTVKEKLTETAFWSHTYCGHNKTHLFARQGRF